MMSYPGFSRSPAAVTRSFALPVSVLNIEAKQVIRVNPKFIESQTIL